VKIAVLSGGCAGARREAVHTAAPTGRGGVVADLRMVLQRKIPNARHRRGALRRDQEACRRSAGKNAGEFKLSHLRSEPGR
jgi:hypothetical protein